MLTILAQAVPGAIGPDAVPAKEGFARVSVSGMSLMDVVSPYMLVFFAAFFTAIVLTPVMRWLAVRNNVVDWPDLKRKNHAHPVAYLGGVAIFLGWLVGVSSSWGLFPTVPTPAGMHFAPVNFPLTVVVGAAVITLTGFFDDVYGITPRVKIAGQLFTAAALASERVGTQLVEQSLVLLGFHPPEWLTYILGAAVIAGFVLGGCNAVNLLDGLDGLAAGVTGIACVGFLIIAALTVIQAGVVDDVLASEAAPARVVMCLAILGAILGFLPYNFNPATIFMGDAGSLLLGYLSVATILMFASAGGGAMLLVTASLIVFAVPITDTSLAIFRRKMRGQPLFSPDNQHIHHLLRRMGFSVKKAVLIMYGAGVVFAALGVSMVWLGWQWRYVLAVFFVLYGFIMVSAYKYGHLQYVLEQEGKSRVPEGPELPEVSEKARRLGMGESPEAAGGEVEEPSAAWAGPGVMLEEDAGEVATDEDRSTSSAT